MSKATPKKKASPPPQFTWHVSDWSALHKRGFDWMAKANASITGNCIWKPAPPKRIGER